MYSPHLKWLHNYPLLIMVSYCLVSSHVYSQEDIRSENDESIIIGKSMILTSKVLQEKRKILVYCPEGYDQSMEKYPVIYLLDGEDNFFHMTGIVQFLSKNELIPKMIVVGIINTDRSRDFTPTNIGAHTGGGEQFLKFLNCELLPFIEKNYRTQPYKILAGHSLGGMFSIFAFITSPQSFNSFIIMSPSLYWDDKILIKRMDLFIKPKMKLKKTLYITYTSDPIEQKYSVPSINDFIKILEMKMPEELEWKFYLMENEDHGSGPHKALYNGLEFIFSGWKMKPDVIKNEGIETVRKHYKKLTEKYEYEIHIPESVFAILEQTLLEQKKTEEAIKIFQENIDLYPNSLNTYVRLGELYESLNQINLAERNFEIAFNKAKEQSNPYIDYYKRKVDRIKNLKIKKEE